MAEGLTVERTTAFGAYLSELPAGEGLRLAERRDLGIATILQRGTDAGGRARIEAALGIAASDGPGATVAGESTLIATGPGTWLLLRERAGPAWVDQVEDSLAGAASVVDQSSGYAVLQIAGGEAWRLLAKGAFLDLHPESFPPGSAAVTLIAHMGAILWRRPDAELFEVAVFRSHAASFWHWLVSAAEAEGWPLVRAGAD